MDYRREGGCCIRKEANSKHAKRNIEEAKKKIYRHFEKCVYVYVCCVSITVLAGRSHS